MTVLFYYILIVNIIAFVLIGYDKFLAKNKKKQIPEKTLLSFVFFGGTLSSAIAMVIFRHKTSKKNYLWKFWSIMILQILLLYFLYQCGFISKIIG
ncbi:DUF1294 domain-containing protein [Flavobacterium faecale]|uniref:DUF1294 domain-containing protein n=1 Tax=Flavobacterium faecale TaxID=1355330 RepID=UPI003AB0177D